MEQPASFARLSSELIELIARQLEPDDLFAFRLVCRAFNEATFCFSRTCLATVRTDLSRESLQELEALAANERLRTQVRTLLFHGTTDIGRGFVWHRHSPSGYLSSPLQVPAVQTLRHLLLHRLVNCRSFQVYSPSRGRPAVLRDPLARRRDYHSLRPRQRHRPAHPVVPSRVSPPRNGHGQSPSNDGTAVLRADSHARVPRRVGRPSAGPHAGAVPLVGHRRLADVADPARAAAAEAVPESGPRGSVGELPRPAVVRRGVSSSIARAQAVWGPRYGGRHPAAHPPTRREPPQGVVLVRHHLLARDMGCRLSNVAVQLSPAGEHLVVRPRRVAAGGPSGTCDISGPGGKRCGAGLPGSIVHVNASEMGEAVPSMGSQL